jgi:uncharacterized membrane protein
MNKKIVKISFLIISLGVLLISLPVFAQKLVDPMGLSENKPIEDILLKVSQWVFGLASPLAILMGVWAAVLFISAGGSPDRIKKGKETLTWAVIGLAVVLLANSMANILKTKINGVSSLEGEGGVISILTGYLPMIGGPLAIVMFIIGAFLYATGNPKNITKANQIFIWTSVGLVILIAASSIGTIVKFFITP